MRRHLPSLYQIKNFLKHFSPNQIITEVITNHSHLQDHLFKIGLATNNLCTLCQQEKEDWDHLLLYCPKLIKTRIKLFQQFFKANNFIPTSKDDFFINPKSFKYMIKFLSFIPVYI